MTREEARKAAEVMLAYANGEEIEVLSFGEYEPCKSPSFNWWDGRGLRNYRVKTKPTYRPFKDKEECWNEMLKHEPFGFIKGKRTQNHYNIVAVHTEDNKTYVSICDLSGIDSLHAEYVFSCYTFADGTPFGIREE